VCWPLQRGHFWAATHAAQQAGFLLKLRNRSHVDFAAAQAAGQAVPWTEYVQHNVRSSFEHAFPDEVPQHIQLVSNCTLLGERERAELGAPEGARCSSGPRHQDGWVMTSAPCRRVVHMPRRPRQFTGTAFATTKHAGEGVVLDTASGTLMAVGSEYALMAVSNLWHTIAMEGLGGSIVVTSRLREACDPPPQPLWAPRGALPQLLPGREPQPTGEMDRLRNAAEAGAAGGSRGQLLHWQRLNDLHSAAAPLGCSSAALTTCRQTTSLCAAGASVMRSKGRTTDGKHWKQAKEMNECQQLAGWLEAAS
jgi:hypothetical protein